MDLIEIAAAGQATQAIENHGAVKAEFLAQRRIPYCDYEPPVMFDAEGAAPVGIFRSHDICPRAHDCIDRPRFSETVPFDQDFHERFHAVGFANYGIAPVFGQATEISDEIFYSSRKLHDEGKWALDSMAAT